MPIVPAHISSTTGMFCSGGGLETESGYCQHGCDHAEHYSNDGHPECEENVTLPPPRPFHRWRTNEDIDFHSVGDYCLACGVKRWHRDASRARTVASGPCPGDRSWMAEPATDASAATATQ